MAYRRGYARRYLMPRRPRRPGAWIHQVANNASPSAQNNVDLLSSLRSALGVSVNLPEIRIWRIKLRVSIRFSITTLAASQGALVAVFVDSKNQTVLDMVANPFDQHFTIYDMNYASRQEMEAGTQGTNGFAVTRSYNTRCRARLRNLTDTLFMQINYQGGVTPTDYSYASSIYYTL